MSTICYAPLAQVRDFEVATGRRRFSPHPFSGALALVDHTDETHCIDFHCAGRQIAFVDRSVAGYEQIVAGMPPGLEVRCFDGSSDGLSEMAAWAKTHSGYQAIHLLAHGSTATLQLGTFSLSEAGLASARVKADLACIGRALWPGGDLLVYGCGTGCGTAGARFLEGLAKETGAHVAGSTGVVGAGRWSLDQRTGPIRATPLAITGFTGTLVTPTDSFQGCSTLSTEFHCQH